MIYADKTSLCTESFIAAIFWMHSGSHACAEDSIDDQGVHSKFCVQDT